MINSHDHGPLPSTSGPASASVGDRRPTRFGSRRLCEAALAVFLGILAIPAIVVICVMSAVLYRAWPIFTHDRVGRGGRSFPVRKIRTLPPDTGRYTAKYDLVPRQIPSMMRLVRRLHLDELPQLWSIVRGDMAFVGPRPEMRFLHDRLPAAFASRRTSVVPGLTGLWQVSSASPTLIGEHPEYDLYYVEHANWRLDLWVLYRTAVKVVTGRTADLGQVPRWAPGGDALDERLAQIDGAGGVTAEY